MPDRSKLEEVLKSKNEVTKQSFGPFHCQSYIWYPFKKIFNVKYYTTLGWSYYYYSICFMHPKYTKKIIHIFDRKHNARLFSISSKN